MIRFVNAKINLGLQIVGRREDGYHDLQTVFYPIGLYAGLPENPVSFCDILEILPTADNRGIVEFSQTGRQVDCPPEKNLVVRAANLFYDRYSPDAGVAIRLEKYIPDGAGIGGGSADAAFTLKMLNELTGVSASEAELGDLALELGADCPFFLINTASFAAGIGELLTPIPKADSLEGKWLLLVKPDVYISTREAFAGVHPHPAVFDLRTIFDLPIEVWRECVHNDFEDSVFPVHPELQEIKSCIYGTGALYASLTGSGSCLYGIYPDYVSAQHAERGIRFSPTIKATYLLKL